MYVPTPPPPPDVNVKFNDLEKLYYPLPPPTLFFVCQGEDILMSLQPPSPFHHTVKNVPAPY